jgi:16S rRNA (uracil1498-N3)-methyltransferase
MRAIYIESQTFNDSELVLQDDSFHHLVHVCRAKVGEKVLLLDGVGGLFFTRVDQINKKEIKLILEEEKRQNRSQNVIKVLIGIPKKDALDLMLKMSVEMGVQEIILFRSEYSSEKLPSMDRIQKILIQALEQSNNPWLPQVSYLEDLSDMSKADLDIIVMHPSDAVDKSKPSSPAGFILAVGPEGGWSPHELAFFETKKVEWLSLNTPILRAPTALAFGLGLTVGLRELE